MVSVYGGWLSLKNRDFFVWFKNWPI